MIVLDASAVLAYLFDEAGADIVEPAIAGAHISSVNYSEVLQKLMTRGIDARSGIEHLELLGLLLAPFTADHAVVAAELHARTASFGLSLGDRACLALGVCAKLPVMTADRAWVDLAVGLEIQIIR